MHGADAKPGFAISPRVPDISASFGSDTATGEFSPAVNGVDLGENMIAVGAFFALEKGQP